jgi:colanic acid/amylovoran biosynthesis glycosyltransferase
MQSISTREVVDIKQLSLGMFIPEFPTQTHAFFWREIEALRASGVSVTIISTKKPSEICPHAFAEIARMQTHYVFPPNLTSFFVLLATPARLFRTLKYVATLTGGLLRKIKLLGYIFCAADLLRYTKQIGITHIHVHSCADAAHIASMAELLGGPTYSLHLHGDLQVYGADHQQKCERATFIAAAAAPMESHLKTELKIAEGKTHTLRMGIETSKFINGKLRRKSQSPFRITSISRLHVNKGHTYALQAVRNLVRKGFDLKYTIAGTGPFQDGIINAISEFQLDDYVCLTGSLSEDQVIELLNNSDGFVLSSVGIGEASPVAVMEAMAAGVPVICSAIGGTPEMILNGDTGFLVRQRSHEDIEAALELLYSNDSIWNKISTSGRLYAAREFDCNVTSNKLLNAIKLSLA